MRKNHSKIVCIKLVHLPYLLCSVFVKLANAVSKLYKQKDDVHAEAM